MKDQFYNFIRGLQDKITKELESIDGKAKFNEDLWERSEGGGGRSRIIENGNVIEKGGVNISAVDGPLLRVCKSILMLMKLIFLLVD